VYLAFASVLQASFVCAVVEKVQSYQKTMATGSKIFQLKFAIEVYKFSKHVHVQQFEMDENKIHVLATKLISTTVDKTKLKWQFEVAQKGAEVVIKGMLPNGNSSRSNI